MKKVLLALSLFSVVACSSGSKDSLVTEAKAETPAIEEKIKAYMQQNAHDPASYEPIKTILVDTVTYGENITDALESNQRKISLYTTDIMKEEKDKLQKVVAFYQHQQDSLTHSANPNAIAALVYTHECRLKNGLGALVKTTYQVETDKDGNIQEVFDLADTSRRVTYPGGFPR